MAIDPFEDDPFGEVQMQEWRRAARTARQSLQRVQRRQATQVRRGIPAENLEQLDPGDGQQQIERGGLGGGIGGNEVVEALRQLNDQAREIKELLQAIKEGLPLVGTYGP